VGKSRIVELLVWRVGLLLVFPGLRLGVGSRGFLGRFLYNIGRLVGNIEFGGLYCSASR
jgi:hypothetical protein